MCVYVCVYVWYYVIYYVIWCVIKYKERTGQKEREGERCQGHVCLYPRGTI